MGKSGVIVGGAIGAIAVIAVFAFILIPTSLQPEIPSNDLILKASLFFLFIIISRFQFLVLQKAFNE